MSKHVLPKMKSIGLSISCHFFLVDKLFGARNGWAPLSKILGARAPRAPPRIDAHGPYSYYYIGNGNGNENISNAPPTVDRRHIT